MSDSRYEIMLQDDDENYAAIGKIASLWAFLELQIDFMVWHLAGLGDNEGAAITSQFFSPIPRLDALIALSHLNGVDTKSIAKLDGYANEIRGMVKKRNRFIHDPLVWDHTDSQVGTLSITTKTKGGVLHADSVPFDREAALAFASEIVTKTKKFHAISVTVKAQADAFRSKMPEVLD